MKNKLKVSDASSENLKCTFLNFIKYYLIPQSLPKPLGKKLISRSTYEDEVGTLTTYNTDLNILVEDYCHLILCVLYKGKTMTILLFNHVQNERFCHKIYVFVWYFHV